MRLGDRGRQSETPARASGGPLVARRPRRYDAAPMVPAPADTDSAADEPSGDPPRGFRPDTAVASVVRPGGSKSIGQRVVACAALSAGRTRVEGLPSTGDVLAALRCARAAGTRFPTDGKPDDLLATALVARGAPGVLEGAPPGPREAERRWATFPVGESGTSARIFAAVGALGRPPGSGCELKPSGTLRRRSSPALFDALRRAGAGVQHARDAQANSFEVALTAATPPRAVELQHPVSSQEASALLIALACHEGPRDLLVVGDVPSRPYLDLTLRVLERFGVLVTEQPVRGDGHGHGGTRFTITGPLRSPTEPVEIEPDASSAATALVAGAIRGTSVTVPGIGTRSGQPDARAVPRALALAGCRDDSSHGSALVVEGRASRGFEFDCTACPDLAPPLAALAAFVARTHGEASRLTGLGTLPGKESSRIEVLARGLQTLGYDATATDASLLVAPPGAAVAGEHVLDPEGDHRMAFAFALLSLFEPGVQVADPGCVKKSWPTFWSDLVSHDD